jgi:hypothetical protein
MCPQRMSRPEESFRPTTRWWVPAVNDASGKRMPVEPRDGDAYVVVDEMVEERVRLVVAAWPHVDRDGRLYFNDLGRRRGPYASTTLQALIDRHRTQQGQVPRPLRVGDAFLVRGDTSRLRGWTYVLDITRGARAVAKVALARAVTATSPVPERPRSRRGSGSQVGAGSQPRRPAEPVAGSVALPDV